ncbi:aquaporin [Martelella lutilitoris]|uniref:Aquaporin n=1 Tax=Martelella lutilitoris TaxID=2583532 RepID=A0A5C4JS93_9HYPH|nr:aquaporin [Martelella lutilitoris]TNB47569.1 aquaporin [Martelella lutilitoris]
MGPVSGCHVNPAVGFGVYISGRMPAGDVLRYWVAQFAGALAGAAILAVIAGSTENRGQNGCGPGYLGEYALPAALIFEVVFTAIFVVVILGSTGKAAAAGFAGLAIGLTLTAIHLVGIQVTGVSSNPARSFGPAPLAGDQALSQLWLFIVASLAGGLLGALFFRFKLLED